VLRKARPGPKVFGRKVDDHPQRAWSRLRTARRSPSGCRGCLCRSAWPYSGRKTNLTRSAKPAIYHSWNLEFNTLPATLLLRGTLDCAVRGRPWPFGNTLGPSQISQPPDYDISGASRIVKRVAAVGTSTLPEQCLVILFKLISLARWRHKQISDEPESALGALIADLADYVMSRSAAHCVAHSHRADRGVLAQ
jgi:hypothetical protein